MLRSDQIRREITEQRMKAVMTKLEADPQGTREQFNREYMLLSKEARQRMQDAHKKQKRMRSHW